MAPRSSFATCPAKWAAENRDHRPPRSVAPRPPQSRSGRGDRARRYHPRQRAQGETKQTLPSRPAPATAPGHAPRRPPTAATPAPKTPLPRARSRQRASRRSKVHRPAPRAEPHPCCRASLPIASSQRRAPRPPPAAWLCGCDSGEIQTPHRPSKGKPSRSGTRKWTARHIRPRIRPRHEGPPRVSAPPTAGSAGKSRSHRPPPATTTKTS